MNCYEVREVERGNVIELISSFGIAKNGFGCHARFCNTGRSMHFENLRGTNKRIWHHKVFYYLSI